MNFDLELVPFSRRGSYMAISHLPECFRGERNKAGLHLKNLHGTARWVSIVAQITPVFAGQALEYTYEATPAELVIQTEKGRIGICYADTDTLLFQGTGEVGLLFDLDIGDGKKNKLFYQVQHEGQVSYMMNSNKNLIKYLMTPVAGTGSVDQQWSVEGTTGCTFAVYPENGGFLLAAEEVETQWRKKRLAFDYESCLRGVEEDYQSFVRSMPTVPARYEAAREIASYVNWSCLVKKNGFLNREAMLMSKNWMTNVWAWDHCFNALVLASGDPQLAYDQFMLLFDYQDETGEIPDSINDCGAWFNWCKPPVHGWAFRKMAGKMTFSTEQYIEVYHKLAKYTNWWMAYRDMDGDGLYDYYHGNDSGWDNASVFRLSPNMELPDLTAFLIVQMDALSWIAETLGWEAQAKMWKSTADSAMERLLAHFFADGVPKALINGTHQEVENQSLILYLPVILGQRLPQNIRQELVRMLKSDQFLTEYGMATESPNSPYYVADGYWLGPIWGPSTMIIVEGLVACGEEEFAREVVERFSKLILKSGCAENFDALTGEGLRDRGYTWTASAFLVMANEHLS